MTDETAPLTPVFWALLLATAVATGLLGSALMFLLTTVEHLAFGYDSGTLEDGAEHASAVRRVTSLVVAGAFGGVAWYLLRRCVLLGSLCLGSGMSGGLFTPVLSTGAAFGGVLGAAWSLLWPGVPSGAYAMIGAAALIGAAMQAPLSALVLVLELTHVGFGLVLPMTVAVVTATAVARWVDGYSIYSARLSTISP